MNFIIKNTLIFIPIILIFTFIYLSGWNFLDYAFHFANRGHENYPPLTSWIINSLSIIVERTQAIFLTNLTVNVILPTILIRAITKDDRASFIYLYGSGISCVMFLGWFIPQGLINNLILLTILNPIGIVIFAMLGPIAHREWFAGFLLAVGYIYYMRHKNGIFKMVRFRLGITGS